MPQACQPNPSFAHLKPNQLLPLDGSDLPVVFHSHATCANWGCRKLSHKETAHAVDVPVRLVNDSTGLAVWVARHRAGLVFPLKPLQMAAQLLLQTLGSADTVPDDSPVQPADEHPSLGTWLPCIQRELSHAWALADAVSAKALKADNAQIATGMWDKRVSLVLPWNHTNMAGLRRLVFGGWQRTLRREFQTCMCSTSGSAWLDRVLECRRRALLPPAQREFSSPRSLQQGGGGGVGNSEGRLGNNGLSRSSKRANKAKSESEEAHLIKDAKIGCEALEHVLDSTWCEWTNGSGLLFWRWNAGAQRTAARDGMTVFVLGALPGFMNKSRPVDEMKLTLLASKIGTVRKRGHIKAGPVKSLADFFDVPKGDDIRMVCHGTSSGFNDALWAPSFSLPTADAAGRLLSHSSFCVNLDLGEMFLNFPVDEKLRPCAGVDLTQLAPEFDKQAQADANGGLFDKCVLNENSRFYERWERLFMGMRPSPCDAVRCFY
jgi:hypothetical protein